MRLAMEQQQAMTRQWAAAYQKARKQERGKILDHFIQSTQYQRAYAARVLRTHCKRVRVGPTRRDRGWRR